ncbi:PLDc N-terminal domain-containing protein [Spirillospora sp. CA-294931]|uniref:PLDc N-terminal domain-containing protein n=1 Tax=Spirillospora sp. CA-294931 TaxID=3240042 RepID=UPI003D9494B0
MAFVLLALIMVGVWLFSLFDVLGTDEAEVRHLPKFGWILVVLLGLLPGAVLWLMLGRARTGASRQGPRHASGPLGTAPKGPEDDPAFLRDLDRRLRGEE